MIELIETKKTDYCLYLAERDEDCSVDELKDNLNRYLYKLWEIYSDGKKYGVVICLAIDKIFTLDGYAEKGNFKKSVIAGKLACKEIFKFTDVIWTIHRLSMNKVTLLSLMIGFRIDQIKDDFIFLRKEKIWV